MSDVAQIEKIARMSAFEIPQAQIARAMGLSEARISQIVNSDEYKEKLAGISTEYFEQNQTLNDGWNTLEASALDVLLTNISWNKDPDFALKAATMANKANRRGDMSNRTIDGQTGARAVFHLTANFIERLQQMNVVKVEGNGAENGEKKISQKLSDYMSPEKVERLFVTQDKKESDSVLNFFPEMNDMVSVE